MERSVRRRQGDPGRDAPRAGERRRHDAGAGAVARAARRRTRTLGIVLFGYANPIVVMGAEAFAAAAHEAGADGVLCVDYPARRGRRADDRAGASRGSTSSRCWRRRRRRRASTSRAKVASGFIYYVSLTGITGTHARRPGRAARAGRRRSGRATGGKVPVAVGFGIRTPGAARAVASFADGVVVGSAAVEVVEKAVAAKKDPVPELAAFVRSLRDALQVDRRLGPISLSRLRGW